MALTWQLWTSVSEGVSTPGAPVTAMPWEGSYALFVSDAGGGIYAIKAVPGYGWEAVPGLTSKPGAPVTAMWSGNRFTLFMADVNGGIFTTSGVPYQGWDPWTSVSEGVSTPGAPVTAMPWEGSYALFTSDAGGGIYAIKAVPGYGWEAVPGLTSKPGAPVTAVRWYKPPTSVPSYERFLLFTADVNGEIYATSGIPYQGWDRWTRVPGLLTTPGGRVTAAGSGPFTLFAANSGGAIRETKTAAPPARPDLVVTSVTTQKIGVSWSESNPASVELGGFVVRITRMTNGSESKVFLPGPASSTFTFTGLDGGVEYEIRISAYNDNGYSPESTVHATTPNVAVTASLSAAVAGLPQSINSGLSITGHNFGASEAVQVIVDWKVGDQGPVTYPLLPQTTNLLGYFEVWFTGPTSYGLCPISVPFGDPQPSQTFNVRAIGLTSNKTASASAGPYTCPL
jgi:hypothetical protein